MQRRHVFLISFGLLVIAAGLALLRWSQIRTELKPGEISFTEPNSITWDPSSRELRVVGGDPFGYIDLPGGNVPLVRLTLSFDGPIVDGGWYVYPAPAELPVVTIKQDWVVTARLTETGDGGFEATWVMRPSRAARIDLPDGLTEPLLLRSATLESAFASGTNGTFAAMVVFGILGAILIIGAVLWPLAHRTSLQWGIAALLVAAKLWLITGMSQTIFAQAMHDDKLFMQQGMSIHAGEWLGEFWELTLAKGPTFSAFIALSHATGLSLQFNEVLLHALACLLLVAAVAPWLRHPAWRLALLLVLLFEPHSMSAELIGRVLRGAIQPALTVFTLAGLLGLLVRADHRLRVQWPWGILAGLAGGAFWYSREEGIWLAPTAVLITGATVFAGWRAQGPRRWPWLATLLLPLILFQAVCESLRVTNDAHYGVRMGVDVTEGSYREAYAAMLRVTQPDPIPSVPITSATRKLIYAQSPAFAEMEELLEGYLTDIWAKSGWESDPSHPRAHREIRGGWYQWAIRSGASYLGHYESATKAERYWQRVADEINAAVDDGRLPGGRKRHGMFPVWNSAYNVPMVYAWFKALDLLVRFTDFKAQSTASNGEPDEIAFFADFLHARPAVENQIPTLTTHARIVDYRFFALIGWPLTGLALLATGRVAWLARTSPPARLRLAVLLSLWGGAAALALVCALVHVTSFYAVIGAYLGPAVPMVLSCWVLAPAWAWGETAKIPAA